MTGLNFGSTVDLLKNALSGADAAHGAFAHNIANANTPNFHRTTVSFQAELAAAGGLEGQSDDLQLASTGENPGSFGAGKQEFSPTVNVDDQSKMRQDGNNVDIDQEMSQLSMNADYSQTGAEFLKNQYTLLRQAITG